MDDFTLKAPKGATHKRKIVGRGSGSGHGGTSGKGNKGQNSRSGGGVRPGFEGGQMPLFRRIARRGFSNEPFKKEYLVVNLQQLEKRYSDGETVDLTSLKKRGIISGKNPQVKILGDGDFTRKVIVEGLAVSRSAQEKIEKAGGRIGTAESSR